MFSLLTNLKWRYATKKYDTTKKVSAEDLNDILEAVRLAPTGNGAQAFKVFVVTNPEIRAKLRQAAYGQSPVEESSVLLVFAVPKTLTKEHMDTYLGHVASERKQTLESLQGYKDSLYGMTDRPADLNLNWMKRQVYIPLGFALIAAAEKKIDATPMEGFDPKQFDQILGLDKKGYESVVIEALGYRSAEDKYADAPKARFPKDELFEFVK